MRRGLAIIVSVLLFACGGGSAIPTETEARAFLGQLVDLARAGDIERVCDVSMCIRDDFTKPLDAPARPPIVIGTRVLEGTSSGDQQSVGGRVLMLCGVDAEGLPYRSEILVYRWGNGLRTQSFRYWTNMGVSEGNPPVTVPGPPADGACPA